jgi:hypothetical protein
MYRIETPSIRRRKNVAMVLDVVLNLLQLHLNKVLISFQAIDYWKVVSNKQDWAYNIEPVCVGLFLAQLNFNKRILSLTLQILLSIIAFTKLWLLKYYWCIWHIKCFLHVSVNMVNPKKDTCFSFYFFLQIFFATKTSP